MPTLELLQQKLPCWAKKDVVTASVPNQTLLSSSVCKETASVPTYSLSFPPVVSTQNITKLLTVFQKKRNNAVTSPHPEMLSLLQKNTPCYSVFFFFFLARNATMLYWTWPRDPNFSSGPGPADAICGALQGVDSVGQEKHAGPPQWFALSLPGSQSQADKCVSLPLRRDIPE